MVADRSVRPLPRLLLAASLVASAAALAAPAAAEPSAWLFAGGGAGQVRDVAVDRAFGRMDLQLGVGTPAAFPVVLGALVGTSTFFSGGTDLTLLGRVASGGFARGSWGVALDGGVYSRSWSSGTSGWDGALVLGGPFGVQLQADARLGEGDARSLGLVVGFDLLRLTVFRTSGLGQWPNPSPAVLPDGSAPAR